MSGEDETTEIGPVCMSCGRDLPAAGAPCPNCSPTADADATITDGDTLPGFTGPKQIGRYRILEELGAGGMGTVFEAYDEEMRRKVALKVLSRHHAPSDRAGQRFEQEAWIAGKLDHPNLVKVYERGTWEELSYFSMELITGGSLQEVIGNMKRWGRDDRLNLAFGSREYVEWAINRIIDAARGLDYAHRQKVVHRDIKPMNLLLSRELGTVKIADFGLAIDEEATRLTTAGKILGTLPYMAPEQLLGKREEIGAATDVYALGVTLFELLTLEYPFAGETQQLYMNAALSSAARRASKLNERVGRDLEVVIGKALEKAPRDRYQSVATFAEDLENVLLLRPIKARPPGRPERVLKWARRKPIHAALIVTLIIGAPLTGFLAQRAIEHRRLVRAERVAELRQELRMQSVRRNYRSLLATCSEILALKPDDVYTLRTRAMSAAELGMEEIALTSLAELRRAVPDQSWPHRLAANVLADLDGGRAKYTAEIDEANALAERFRADEPSDDDLHYDALALAERGEHEQAVELLDQLIGRRPHRIGAFYARATSYETLGMTAEAIADFRHIATVDIEDATARNNLAFLLVETGSLVEAREHFRAARDLDPDQAAHLIGLSHVTMELGRWALNEGDVVAALEQFRQAEALARESLAMDDRLPWAHANLGASLAEQYRWQEDADPELMAAAMEQYELEFALWSELGPGGGRDREARNVAMTNLCDAYLQTGDLKRGLAYCRMTAEESPDDPISFYNLAGAYALLGRSDEALEALERDLALGDTDHEYLEHDAWFESLRGDPRFNDLLKRMRRAAAAHR